MKHMKARLIKVGQTIMFYGKELTVTNVATIGSETHITFIDPGTGKDETKKLLSTDMLATINKGVK